MDTDDLTKEAYNVLILQSEKVSKFLTAEIGAAARLFSDEDEYLNAMLELVCEVADEPCDYLDFWTLFDIVEPEDLSDRADILAAEIKRVMEIPIAKRGPVEWLSG